MQLFTVLYKYRGEFKHETFTPEKFARFLEKKSPHGNVIIIDFEISSTQTSLW